MADPICRWRNPYISTVREFINFLPKKRMGAKDFRIAMSSVYGGQFFHTPYQLACQLGLYVESEDSYIPRFEKVPDIIEVNNYLRQWLRKYVVPNPYTKKGFDNIKSTSIHSQFCEFLLSKKNSMSWAEAKLLVFKEEIGNDDILINTINSYSEILSIRQNVLSLKDGAEYTDLNSFITEMELPNRNDKEAFFHLFDDIPTNSDNDITEENNVIIEESSIRDFALNVFTYFYKEKWIDLINKNSSGQASLNSKKYISHNISPFSRLLGEFDSPQTKDDLSSSGILRFFEEPIYKDDDRYLYFNNQWVAVGNEGLTYQVLKKHFESIFSEYEFEKTETNFRLIKRVEVQQKFNLDFFYHDCLKSGLRFHRKTVSRFISSLCTKPFVICTGLSGSGKTKLAQSFAHWICRNKCQYQIVSVGADWTNREPLLGFKNSLNFAEYVFPDNGALELILRATEQPKLPFFLILDEMNLSHVERYFADFLSIMESGDTIKLYSGAEISGLQKEVTWPKNLYIVGTVNIDETTYMFSPKVLDRANVIEFRVAENEMEIFLNEPEEIDLKKINGNGLSMAESFLAINQVLSSKHTNDDKSKVLILFFKELKKCGAEFGYRTAAEIMKFARVVNLLEPDWDSNTIIDAAIMQKLLPKLHGSRSKISGTLTTLAKFCIENATVEYEGKDDDFRKIFFKENIDPAFIRRIIYPLSFEKLARMYKNAIDNGYTSYAEA